MFLKRVVIWPDSFPAAPVDLGTSAPARQAFSKAVHRKSVAAVSAFWRQQIFKGRDVPPAEKGSEADVIEFVRTHPGAIGYVSPGRALGADVKTMQVLGG